MSRRAERRHRTERTIARRIRTNTTVCNFTPRRSPHEFHKHDPAGHCSNRKCTICSWERAWKKQVKKRERAKSRREEKSDD